MDLIFTGQPHEITLPSGRLVRIRETNGDDDEILSTLKDARQGDSVFNFLANIILEDNTKPGKPSTVVDLLDWPVSDRYYLLFKQRIINQGHLLEFDFICQTPDCPSQKDGEKAQSFQQDLHEYDGDLADANYKPHNIHQVKPYPRGSNKQVEFELSSKKRLRYKILTGVLEKKRLDGPLENSHKNSHLVIREIEVYNQDRWTLLTQFKAFSSKEMSEIRRSVDTNDPLFDPVVKFNCPVCKAPYNVPLFQMPVFYWPEERM